MKSPNKKNSKKANLKNFPTLNLGSERDIAMDFAQKVYQKFSNIVKSIVLFGSTAKKTRVTNSDIDIIIVIDDVSVKFDTELIAWYREELGKIIAENPYKQELHINTVKLSTWWNDLMKLI
jgi:predicted nucleotidyltransferase